MSKTGGAVRRSEYRGVQYEIVPIESLQRWKWTIYFSKRNRKTGLAFTKKIAVTDVKKAIDEEQALIK